MVRKWLQLMSQDHQALSPVASVSVHYEDLDGLEDAVKTKFPNTLAHIESFQLVVYVNQAAYTTQKALEVADASIEEFGNSKDSPLIVKVPHRQPHVTGASVLRKRTLQDLKEDLPAPSSFAMPNDLCSVPIVLLHETFAQFEKNCNDIDFGSSDCDFVVKFCETMPSGYETKALMAEKARDLLEDYLFAGWAPEAWIQRIAVNQSTSDGSYLCGKSVILNLDVRVGQGEGDGDPTMQNLAFYIKSLPKSIDRSLPCYLLDLCGPLLSISGIVNVGDEAVLSTPSSVSRSKFPYKDTARIDGQDVKLNYVEGLHHYVFTAQVDKSECEVIVKFAKQYGNEVHEYCAQADFAPKLLYSKFLVNDWAFVVMERLSLLPVIQAPSKASVINQLEKIKTQLSATEFVHGDLRESNIQWDSVNNRVVLMDFDWAGRNGAVMYPPFMNSDISWPQGAETNKPLRIEHDAYWLDLLLVKLKLE